MEVGRYSAIAMTPDHPTESGLVIPVPSLHDFVAPWRPKVDRVAPVGIPAHITLLYPFIAPVGIAAEIDHLREFFSHQPQFSYSLTGIGWFGDEVVFIKPSPPAPFISLTTRIQERWGLPPYGDTIAKPQPHLTIGFAGQIELMHEAADTALQTLPIHERATEVWLMQGKSDPPEWSVTHRFHLGH